MFTEQEINRQSLLTDRAIQVSLVDLNVKLEEWQNFYNYHRPHSALAGKTPHEMLREKLSLNVAQPRVGGIINPAPDFLAAAVPGVRRTLILLTAPRRERTEAGAGPRLLCIAPEAPLPVRTWDFTRPDLLEATIVAGERDAALYARRLEDFIAGRGECSAGGAGDALS